MRPDEAEIVLLSPRELHAVHADAAGGDVGRTRGASRRHADPRAAASHELHPVRRRHDRRATHAVATGTCSRAERTSGLRSPRAGARLVDVDVRPSRRRRARVDAQDARSMPTRCATIWSGCSNSADTIADDERAARRLLTIVVVGGGFTGVETAGEIYELFRSVVRFYRRLRLDELHDGACRRRRRRCSPGLPPKMGEYSRRVLERRGIEVLTGDGVTVGRRPRA